jgi:hypothetical protein
MHPLNSRERELIVAIALAMHGKRRNIRRAAVIVELQLAMHRHMLGKWRSPHATMERNEETIYYSRVKIGTNLAIK